MRKRRNKQKNEGKKNRRKDAKELRKRIVEEVKCRKGKFKEITKD